MLGTQTVNLVQRPRRNRKSPAIRSLAQETHLLPHMLIAPLFIVDGQMQRQPISGMPQVDRLSLELLVQEVISLYNVGIRAVDLFPVIPSEKKDRWGSEALRSDNLIQTAIRAIKRDIPEMCVMVDIALDPYTDHGHDGLVDDSGQILNDETLEFLGKMALLAAEAGADLVAPSDMMDGRIGYIRNVLDEAGYTNTGILSYAVKYASSLYGPFRNALNASPKGDKKTYQLNPANSREAMREIHLDEQEGADMLLIKPALAYLDIVYQARQVTDLPIGAYQVSGEYAMIMAAAEKGWVDANKVMMECLLSIKRAGADFIFTYAAKTVAQLLQRQYGN